MLSATREIFWNDSLFFFLFFFSSSGCIDCTDRHTKRIFSIWSKIIVIVINFLISVEYAY